MTNLDQSPREWPISHIQKLFLTNFEENKVNQSCSKIMKFEENIHIQVQIEPSLEYNGPF